MFLCRISRAVSAVTNNSNSGCTASASCQRLGNHPIAMPSAACTALKMMPVCSVLEELRKAESGNAVPCNYAIAESVSEVRCSCPLVRCSCHNNFHGLGLLGKLRMSTFSMSESKNISARASARSACAVERCVCEPNAGMAGSVSDPG